MQASYTEWCRLHTSLLSGLPIFELLQDFLEFDHRSHRDRQRQRSQRKQQETPWALEEEKGDDEVEDSVYAVDDDDNDASQDLRFLSNLLGAVNLQVRLISMALVQPPSHDITGCAYMICRFHGKSSACFTMPSILTQGESFSVHSYSFHEPKSFLC